MVRQQSARQPALPYDAEPVLQRKASAMSSATEYSERGPLGRIASSANVRRSADSLTGPPRTLSRKPSGMPEVGVRNVVSRRESVAAINVHSSRNAGPPIVVVQDVASAAEVGMPRSVRRVDSGVIRDAPAQTLRRPASRAAMVGHGDETTITPIAGRDASSISHHSPPMPAHLSRTQTSPSLRQSPPQPSSRDTRPLSTRGADDDFVVPMRGAAGMPGLLPVQPMARTRTSPTLPRVNALAPVPVVARPAPSQPVPQLPLHDALPIFDRGTRDDVAVPIRMSARAADVLPARPMARTRTSPALPRAQVVAPAPGLAPRPSPRADASPRTTASRESPRPDGHTGFGERAAYQQLRAAADARALPRSKTLARF